MSHIDIDKLFDNHRLPQGISIVPIILYFPLGVTIAFLRFFIGIHIFLIACVLPKSSWIRKSVLRVMCTILGVVVTQEGLEKNRDSRVRLLLSNHISVLDHLAIDMVIDNYVILTRNLDSSLQWLLGFVDLGFNSSTQNFSRNIQEYFEASQTSLLAFPEEVSTNGRKGLLKFKEWPFKIGLPIQPVSLQVSRPPFTSVSISVLGSRYVSDVFWHLFVPYTHYHLQILPVISKSDSENTEEFCHRGEQVIADDLQIPVTVYTSSDKQEWMKRQRFQSRMSPLAPRTARNDSTLSESSPPVTRENVQPAEDDRFEVMARQVKEVLSQVPMDVIRKDLATTHDVDMTITNILEGVVKYTPEEADTPQQSSAKPTQSSSVNVSPAKVAAKTFAKTSKDRQLSFEERKRILINTAREKYMIKHGLLGSS